MDSASTATPNWSYETSVNKRISQALLRRLIRFAHFLVRSYLTAGATKQLREHLGQLWQALFRIQYSHRLLHLL